MRLYVLLELHGHARVRGVFDDEATARAYAAVDPAYLKVEAVELNAAPHPPLATPIVAARWVPDPAPTVIQRAPAATAPTATAHADELREGPLSEGPVGDFAADLAAAGIALVGAPLAHTHAAVDVEGHSREHGRVLVRLLDVDNFGDGDAAEALDTVLEVAARVQHPSWAAPCWTGSVDFVDGIRTPALAWRWPAGPTLEGALVAHGRPLGAALAVQVLLPLLDAAQAFHALYAAPVTVCLDPMNVLLTEAGPDLLLGAPLSPAYELHDRGRRGVLYPEGRGAWWGPELWQGRPRGPTGTVYGAAATLLYLLGGSPPTLRGHAPEEARRAAVAALRAARPELPAALLQHLEAAYAPAPSAAFAVPGALAAALRGLSLPRAAADAERARVWAEVARRPLI